MLIKTGLPLDHVCLIENHGYLIDAYWFLSTITRGGGRGGVTGEREREEKEKGMIGGGRKGGVQINGIGGKGEGEY